MERVRRFMTLRSSFQVSSLKRELARCVLTPTPISLNDPFLNLQLSPIPTRLNSRIWSSENERGPRRTQVRRVSLFAPSVPFPDCLSLRLHQSSSLSSTRSVPSCSLRRPSFSAVERSSVSTRSESVNSSSLASVGQAAHGRLPEEGTDPDRYPRMVKREMTIFWARWEESSTTR